MARVRRSPSIRTPLSTQPGVAGPQRPATPAVSTARSATSATDNMCSIRPSISADGGAESAVRSRNFMRALLFRKNASQPWGSLGGGGALRDMSDRPSGRAALRRGHPALPRDNREESVVKRFGSLVVVTSIVAACVVGVAGASAAPTLPTLNVAVTGKTGIAVSGSKVSGAVNVTVDVQRQGLGRLRVHPPEPGRVVPGGARRREQPSR